MISAHMTIQPVGRNHGLLFGIDLCHLKAVRSTSVHHAMHEPCNLLLEEESRYLVAVIRLVILSSLWLCHDADLDVIDLVTNVLINTVND